MPAIQQARVDPALRATSVAIAPGSSIAATSRALSDDDQRRRRSTDVMTSIQFHGTVTTPDVSHSVLRCTSKLARRRIPDGYDGRDVGDRSSSGIGFVLPDDPERPSPAIVAGEVHTTDGGGTFQR